MTLSSEAFHKERFSSATRLIQVFGLFICDACQAPSLAIRLVPWKGAISPEAILDGENEDVLWAPTGTAVKDFPYAPKPIGDTASEAVRCHSIKAYRAALILARTVIEATAKDKGITAGGIMPKINALKDQGFIRPVIAEGAHTVRQLANEMAHGDMVEPTTAEESQLALVLMERILDEVYEVPAQIDAARRAVEARRNPPAAADDQ